MKIGLVSVAVISCVLLPEAAAAHAAHRGHVPNIFARRAGNNANRHAEQPLAADQKLVRKSHSDADDLSVRVEFGSGDRLAVAAKSVRTAELDIKRDGFIHRPKNTELKKAVLHIKRSCGEKETGVAWGTAVSTRPECLKALKDMIPHLEREVVRGIPEVNKATCFSTSSLFKVRVPEFEIASRTGHSLLPMHCDEIKDPSDSGKYGECDVLASAASRGILNVRAWLPAEIVESAPLTLSATAHLFPKNCERRPEVNDGKVGYSPKDYARDCRGGKCDWFHTLGMEPGESLLIRNAFTLHGIGEDARSLRNVSRPIFGFDCWTNIYGHEEEEEEGEEGEEENEEEEL